MNFNMRISRAICRKMQPGRARTNLYRTSKRTQVYLRNHPPWWEIPGWYELPCIFAIGITMVYLSNRQHEKLLDRNAAELEMILAREEQDRLEGKIVEPVILNPYAKGYRGTHIE